MFIPQIHCWNASAPNLDNPDQFILDLDPDPTLPWRTMQEAAMLAKVLLDEIGLESFCKTSGGKGLHLVIPLRPIHAWDEVKQFSHAIARHLARVVPERFSAVSGPRNRVGKIFVDYLRNGRGSTTAAAYSVRARPGLGVSMPISWDEVAAVERGDQWNLRTAPRRRDIPWVGIERQQTITKQMIARLQS
ncbi:non-homologous end-joining DNA ligase LigD [Paraburkholderia caledonica]